MQEEEEEEGEGESVPSPQEGGGREKEEEEEDGEHSALAVPSRSSKTMRTEITVLFSERELAELKHASGDDTPRLLCTLSVRGAVPWNGAGRLGRAARTDAPLPVGRPAAEAEAPTPGRAGGAPAPRSAESKLAQRSGESRAAGGGIRGRGRWISGP